MTARLLKVRATDPDADVVAEAAAVLRAGGLVAFPTETVYGLGAHALDAAAVARIFAAKGRPSYNPLIVHVPDTAAARQLASTWPRLAAAAAAAFWPGPLTLVLPRQPTVPDAVTAGLQTVALRVPSHPVARAIIGAAGVPVAAPSANRFTRLSPTTAEHVARGLGDRVDLIIDGGATPLGIESTVLDVAGHVPVLLRPGIIDLEELESALGPIEVRGGDVKEGEAAPAPGMMGRHYSPAAPLHIYRDPADASRRARQARQSGSTIGCIACRTAVEPADHPIVMPAEPRGYARLLYASLHALDDAGCDVIFVEAVPDGSVWAAVADRLRRAAAG